MKARIFKALCFFLFAVSFTSITNAQVSVSGNIGDTHWSADTIFVIGDVTVIDTTTLTIDPGVVVLFEGHYKLNIQGTLLAIGAEGDTIIFTSSNTSEGWFGIRFSNNDNENDTSKIIYCKLEYGKATGSGEDQHGGALYVYNFSKVVVSNSRITNNSSNGHGGAFYLYLANIKITKNIFTNNTTNNCGGAIRTDNADVIIDGNIFCNNSAVRAGAFNVRYSDPVIVNIIICNNSASSQGGGIKVGHGSSPVISNNKICNNY